MTNTQDISRIDPRSDALSGLLARNWWAVGLRGVCAVLFGIIALLTPTVALLSLVLVFAAYMLIDGIFAIVSAVRAARTRERWGLLLLQGVASLLAAAAAVLMPGIAALTFVYLIAAWAIVSGALAVAATVRLRHDHGRWWMGFSGILSVAVGILLAIAPLAGALVLTWWIAAYALVYGVTLLMLAFRLRPHRAEAHQELTAHPA
ncbi:HdeD family acid-resistance protein [Phenylobacterium hankyongense]|uniref:HdeD family acid-resistance protein n=1 Tax=Phenylobacterium hankyongense TaxID=1813876 RepID=A0A328B3K1_9CAUL|nr:HdeD family acid-resistance protein [Phenylobacterium hankyongense]RAK59578.1 HdeD family acid-resistance protein [Phenylobacterium hankyongense]